MPVPKDTSSYCLRAAGEKGLTQGQVQVQGGLLGCVHCVPQHSLCFPVVLGMVCNAQLVWKNEFRVCSGGTGVNRTGQLLDVSSQDSLASSAMGSRTTDACPTTGSSIKHFST